MQSRIAPLLLLLFMSPAAAQKANLSAVNTLRVQYLTDNRNVDGVLDDQYTLMGNQLDVRGRSGDLDVQLRVDSLYTPLNDDSDECPKVGGPCRVVEEFSRLERVRVMWRLGDFQLEGGDFHLQLGRGIAMSLKSIPTVGVDTALRGARVGYRGQAQQMDVFVGYTNPINFDQVSNLHVNDQDDRMVGARYSLRLDGLPQIGLYGLMLRPEEQVLAEIAEKKDQTLTVGGFIDMPALVDWAALYVEGIWQERRLLDQEETGKAGYAQLDLSVGDAQILIEGLYLDAFEQRGSTNTALRRRFDYNRPPTLERFDQEVFDNRDVVGGRARVELPLFSEDWIFHANGMYRIQRLDQDGESHQYHGFAGFEADLPDHLQVDGGYRYETQDGSSTFLKSMSHVDVDYSHAFGKGYTLHLTGQWQFRKLLEQNYIRGSQFVGVETSEWSTTVEFGYDDQNTDEGIRTVFLAGLVSWRMAKWLDMNQKRRVKIGREHWLMIV